MSEIEHRSAQVADVNFPKRIVTVIAMPYEQPTVIHERARSYTEIVTHGAFDGIQRRERAIKVNRDHAWDKPVGKIVGLHPTRREGLVAEIRISPTPLGDESLALADDNVLDASAGFRLMREDGGKGPVYPDAEVWDENRTIRRLNKLWLDHLALTPDPAYPGATVLSVRNADTPGLVVAAPRPNFARLDLEAKRRELAALDARWGVR
jgi:phage head maturation protease